MDITIVGQPWTVVLKNAVHEILSQSLQFTKNPKILAIVQIVIANLRFLETDIELCVEIRQKFEMLLALAVILVHIPFEHTTGILVFVEKIETMKTLFNNKQKTQVILQLEKQFQVLIDKIQIFLGSNMPKICEEEKRMSVLEFLVHTLDPIAIPCAVEKLDSHKQNVKRSDNFLLTYMLNYWSENPNRFPITKIKHARGFFQLLLQRNIQKSCVDFDAFFGVSFNDFQVWINTPEFENESIGLINSIFEKWLFDDSKNCLEILHQKNPHRAKETELSEFYISVKYPEATFELFMNVKYAMDRWFETEMEHTAWISVGMNQFKQITITISSDHCLAWFVENRNTLPEIILRHSDVIIFDVVEKKYWKKKTKN